MNSWVGMVERAAQSVVLKFVADFLGVLRQHFGNGNGQSYGALFFWNL